MGTTKRWLQLLNRGGWQTEVLLILQYFTDIYFRTLITDHSIKGGHFISGCLLQAGLYMTFQLYSLFVSPGSLSSESLDN